MATATALAARGRWPSALGQSTCEPHGCAICLTTPSPSTPRSCRGGGCCQPKRSAYSPASTSRVCRVVTSSPRSASCSEKPRRCRRARSSVSRTSGRPEYAAWRVRPLAARYAYIWADGIYSGQASSSRTAASGGGRRPRGWPRGAAGLELGYRESTASWASVLRGMRDRGLSAPLLARGDGALGMLAALDEVCPTTRHQRCWNHRALKVLDKVPQRLWPDIRRRLRESVIGSRAACELRRDALVRWLKAHGQLAAADTVLRDWDDFVTYDLRAEHWIHLRTSNPIERSSPASGCGPTSPNACGGARTRCTWCSRSPSASSTPAAR